VSARKRGKGKESSVENSTASTSTSMKVGDVKRKKGILIKRIERKKNEDGGKKGKGKGADLLRVQESSER